MSGSRKRPGLAKSSLVQIDGSKQTISVLGHRPVPATLAETQLPRLMPSKRLRLSARELAALRKKDIAKDKALMEQRMSRAEQADLAAFQQEFTGIGVDNATPAINTADYEEGDGSEPGGLGDDGDDDGWVDEEAVNEGIGAVPKSSEWAYRLASEYVAWNESMASLCDAYLQFRSGSPAPEGESDDVQLVSLPCVNLEDEKIIQFKHLRTESCINATLLRNGYLAPTPSKPSMAISLQVLDILAAVQRRGPAVSIQVMAKAFCDLRNVPYKKHFRTQLASALDAYLLIQRRVQHRLDIALGRDTPDWRMLNSCPACNYTLADEPSLKYSRLVTCDGNDSAKRCAGAGNADRRAYNSSYYITRDQVDKFKNEVPSRRAATSSQAAKEEEPTECEKRWKNAKINNDPDGKPKPVFDETGIFISTCRHSFILTVCDMIRSGEQAKYCLATIDKLISVYGPDIIMGYDIGCTFKGTASRSPLVGPRVCQACFDMCVGTFHGPAHNRSCQMKNHPHNRPGTGLTDFENCETVFSSSNRLASTTRLASAYRRHQKIDIHFDAWDDDQYANLGHLLRCKYLNALKVQEESQAAVAALNPRLSPGDLDHFFNEEQAYLESLKNELPEDTMAIEYITLLERLEMKQLEYDKFVNTEYVLEDRSSVADLRRATLKTRHLEARRRNTMEQLLVLQEAAGKMEQKHKIAERWTHESPEWIEAARLRRNRTFQQRIDELERLVVQRLLELTKAGLANTGYKMRVHIMRAIAARGTAVKTALDRYNKVASEVGAQTISWKQVTDAKILADFDLLRGSRRGILKQDWALPDNRCCVTEWRRALHAAEEITRLNVEVRRVRTSIADESRLLPGLAEQIVADDPPLGWVVRRYVSRRMKLNTLILHELDVLSRTPGYTGTTDVGVRLGSNNNPADVSETAAPPSIDPTAKTCISNDLQGDEESVANMPSEPDDEIADEFDRWQTVLDNVDQSNAELDVRQVV
ncbi:hypothetical protein FRC08_002384 [Ceratobasidium sp. 394]|nr:hypothetical protein FRC08_002384 [Ceratobasidium sp. 394]